MTWREGSNQAGFFIVGLHKIHHDDIPQVLTEKLEQELRESAHNMHKDLTSVLLEHIQEGVELILKESIRINLESDTNKAAVRLTWNKEKKKWLLTAFEKKETSESIDKTTDTDDNPTDLRGDTALSQNSDVSDGKVNTLSADKQGDSTKSRGC